MLTPINKGQQICHALVTTSAFNLKLCHMSKTLSKKKVISLVFPCVLSFHLYIFRGVWKSLGFFLLKFILSIHVKKIQHFFAQGSMKASSEGQSLFKKLGEDLYSILYLLVILKRANTLGNYVFPYNFIFTFIRISTSFSFHKNIVLTHACLIIG